MSSNKISVRVCDIRRASFTKEARCIQTRAARGETVVVRLGWIIYFCANRDAWMLDPEDGLARCLMSDGERKPLGIVESKTRFTIEWNADYRIEDEVFTFVERGTASVRAVTSYPTSQILEFC